MRRRTTAAVAATTLLATGALTVAASRWARGAALGDGSPPPRPAGFTGPPLTVHAVAAGRVTLTRSLDTLLPGTYGLTSAVRRPRRATGPRGTAFAVVGPVLDTPTGPDAVVRRLTGVSHGELAPGSTVALTPQLHLGDPASALGIAHTDVEVPGERGPLPAWFVPGHRDTWVITLHGLGATREHPMNVLPFLHRHQFPVLVPGYQGDPGAPRPRSGLSTLGATEWHDADAVLRYAIRYGARRLVLYGWSTGGAMALHAAAHSPLRARIAGLVLDSPVLDPAATVRALAAQRGVPGPLVPLAVAATRARLGYEAGHASAYESGYASGEGDASGAAGAAGANGGPDVSGAPPDPPPGAGGRPLPVLLVHGPGDTVSPYGASRELAARHPESVVLHTVHHAQHAAMWNADPEGYEEALRRFLVPLM